MFHDRNVRMQNIPNFVSRIDMNLIQISTIHDSSCEFITYKKSHLLSKFEYHLTRIYIIIECPILHAFIHR